MKLSTRPNVYDEEIISEVKEHYYPDLIPYRELRRVVDVGAHIGGFVDFVKEHSPDCTVRAIEQDHDNYRMLLDNVGTMSKVSVYHARCQYVPAAEKWLNLRVKTNFGANTLVRAKQAHSSRPMTEEYELVPACRNIMTLEDLTRQWDSADLLKLDCEGSEFDILSNVKEETLRLFCYIVGEYHTFAGSFMFLYDNRLSQWFDLVQYQDAPDWGRFLLERKNI